MQVAALTANAMRMLGEDRVRYVLVSVVALAIDTLITLNLTWSGLAPAYAAAAGYMIGIGIHWTLSTRFVFAAEVSRESVTRSWQAVMFVFSGLAGLAVTVVAYTSAMGLGVSPAPAKMFAVAVSFCIVYLLRRHFIFPQNT